MEEAVIMRAMAKGTVERAAGAGTGTRGGRNSPELTGRSKRTTEGQAKATTFVRAFVDALNDILR